MRLSATGRARDVLVVGSGQTDIEDRLQAVLVANNRVMTPDATPEAGFFFPLRAVPMAKRGMPMLYMDSGIDLLAGGSAAGRAADDRYRRDAYHQPADEYDPTTWNLAGNSRGMSPSAASAGASARKLARLAELSSDIRVSSRARQERRPVGSVRRSGASGSGRDRKNQSER